MKAHRGGSHRPSGSPSNRAGWIGRRRTNCPCWQCCCGKQIRRVKKALVAVLAKEDVCPRKIKLWSGLRQAARGEDKKKEKRCQGAALRWGWCVGAYEQTSQEYWVGHGTRLRCHAASIFLTAPPIARPQVATPTPRNACKDINRFMISRGTPRLVRRGADGKKGGTHRDGGLEVRAALAHSGRGCGCERLVRAERRRVPACSPAAT